MFQKLRKKSDPVNFGGIGVVWVLLLLIGVGSSGLVASIENGIRPPRVMVLPFRAQEKADASFSWLGRGLSYYLTTALHSNGFSVRQDVETVALLDTNAIFFPYHMGKATALRLAMDSRENILVWGEVGPDPKDKTRILVSGFAIDLKDFSRKKLPTFRGHIQDIFLLLEALFKSLANLLNPGISEQPGFHYPKFRLNPRNYEIFIKSMLLGEPEKQIGLLEKARATDDRSDYLNLALARAYFDGQQYPSARALLAQIVLPTDSKSTPGEALLVMKKRGLSALLDYAQGHAEAALNAFLLLENEKYELFEVRHNIAVIYSQAKNYQAAENYFKRALDLRGDPETWLYRVFNLMAGNQQALAEQYLKTALKYYPGDNQLVGCLPYFLAKTPPTDGLFQLFQTYYPDLAQTNRLPSLTMGLKKPYRVTMAKRYTDHGEFREIQNGSRGGTDETASERLSSLLEANPFLAKYYRLMAQLLLKKKDYSQAERHALAAVFLEPTRESYLILTVVYQTCGNRAKVREMEERMLHLTPSKK